MKANPKTAAAPPRAMTPGTIRERLREHGHDIGEPRRGRGRPTHGDYADSAARPTLQELRCGRPLHGGYPDGNPSAKKLRTQSMTPPQRSQPLLPLTPTRGRNHMPSESPSAPRHKTDTGSPARKPKILPSETSTS